MYSAAIERALRAAVAAHAGQTRKGEPDVPYIVHPMHVALMLSRLGMDEEVIQSALLHDVVEDCPGWTLARVEREFGPRVAAIVGELTEDKSKSWDERKRRAIEHVPHLSPQAASIKAADKLHNLQSLAAALRTAADPEVVWKRFNGGRERTLAMSRELVAALTLRIDARLARALRAALQSVLDLPDATRAPARS